MRTGRKGTGGDGGRGDGSGQKERGRDGRDDTKREGPGEEGTGGEPRGGVAGTTGTEGERAAGTGPGQEGTGGQRTGGEGTEGAGRIRSRPLLGAEVHNYVRIAGTQKSSEGWKPVGWDGAPTYPTKEPRATLRNASLFLRWMRRWAPQSRAM